jgi:hypothetical protein
MLLAGGAVTWWQSFGDFLHHFGDPASIGDLVLSAIGFALTIFAVFKAKTAAQSAAIAANATRNSIRLMNTASISLLQSRHWKRSSAYIVRTSGRFCRIAMQR